MNEKKLWSRIAGDGHREDPLASLALPRRTFLQMVGFSAAALTLESCRVPEAQVVPYLRQPAESTPGVANWYASTCGGCSAACGVLVKTREGRPIKLEGNPEHPLSRGGLCSVAHAMVFDLFDATRLQAPLAGGVESDWKAVDTKIAAKLEQVRRDGRAVRVVTGSGIGPTMQRAIDGLLATFTDGRHVVYDAVSGSAIREAHRRTHGAPLTPTYRFERARLVVGFDADFLGTWISPVQFTRGYADSRDVERRRERTARHIQVESRMSLTGAKADRRVVASPSETLAMIAMLAARMSGGDAGSAATADSGANADSTANGSLRAELTREVSRIEAEVRAHRGEALVVCGLNDPDAQQLVNAINEACGAYGSTVDLDAASAQRRGDDAEMAGLVEAMESGAIGALVVAGVNPVYDLPDGSRFQRALAKVPLTIALSPRRDETSARMQFVCPPHHFLEGWDDRAPVEGVASTVQPAIAPLFSTRSAIESLLRWSGDARDAHTAVRDTWRDVFFPLQADLAGFEAFWERSLHDGVFAFEPRAAGKSVASSTGSASTVPQTTAPAEASAAGHAAAPAAAPEAAPAAAPAAATTVAGAIAATAARAQRPTTGLAAVLYEKPSMRDGAHAGSPWLQELPDPISRIAWENYVCIAPSLARERGIEEGAVLAVTRGQARLELPAHIQPGMHPTTIAIALGYGRSNAGDVGSNVGANAVALMDPGAPRAYSLDGVAIAPTGRSVALATVQPHSSSEGRDLVRRVSLDATLAPAAAIESAAHGDDQMWHGRDYENLKWGMAIDLNACTGCGACVISCQAENNIPVVGRQEIVNQREMYWMRIDRYFDGDERNPDVGFQPIMCGQCDNATCENVCPVLATVHSSDGINMQVYNRCVGTRYCANNCALKARRFNWFEYQHDDPMTNLALNPDVTVRSRGVMEKCTFCVQRLQEGKIRARNEGRELADGDVMTACQQSCPARAISFGNTIDAASEVSRRKTDRRNYVILEEVNMRSALSYLATVRTEDAV